MHTFHVYISQFWLFLFPQKYVPFADVNALWVKTERVSARTTIRMSPDPAGDSLAGFVLLLYSIVFSMQVITPHSLRLTQFPCAQIIMPLAKQYIRKLASDI